MPQTNLPTPPTIQIIFTAVQKATLPGVWSRGLALARENTIQEDPGPPDEIRLRIRVPNRAVSPSVTLWPQEQDWYCDCGDRNDPCLHIAAAVIWLKGSPAVEGKPAPAPGPSGVRLRYRLVRHEGALLLQRWLLGSGVEERLASSLISRTGGIGSGRVAAPPVTATQADFTLDQLLCAESKPVERPDRALWLRVLPQLRELGAELELDGKPVRVGPPLQPYRVAVREEAGGFRLVAIQDPSIIEAFSNGIVLASAPGPATPGESLLRGLEDPDFTAAEKQWLAPPGRLLPRRDAAVLVAEILPALSQKAPLQLETRKLPELSEARPRLLLQLDQESGEALSVLPRLVYGEPPIAEVIDGRLDSLSDRSVPVRNLAAERELLRQLQSELQLSPRQRIRLDGPAAVEFVEKTGRWERTGLPARAYEILGELAPGVSASDEGLGVRFEVPGTGGRTADPARVFQAWHENQALVPLLEGGWARLPRDWLARYGERVLALLASREASGRPALAPWQRPELAELAGELGATVTDSLRGLREALGGPGDGKAVPEAPLPAGLRAELRHYQKRGYDWLCFLREHGLGAMLADDMGLGKTLQALCAARGRTLVVCPTSVMQAWEDQIARFRPGLRHALYYGPGRKLDPGGPGAHVTITTYGLLRLDEAALSAVEWDTLVLDETQTIKNPESQVARSAHRLRGKFRIGLSGTPVENRLEDLWSQFQFLNPGLLGSREEFQSRYAGPLMSGGREAARELRRLIRPFILRRLKKEVAPELPPRTEMVLQCELRPSEREIYDSVLAASRQEVLRLLSEDSKGSVFGALEVLLRLRQACCHAGLIPGCRLEDGTSSKLQLLRKASRSRSRPGIGRWCFRSGPRSWT